MHKLFNDLAYRSMALDLLFAQGSFASYAVLLKRASDYGEELSNFSKKFASAVADVDFKSAEKIKKEVTSHFYKQLSSLKKEAQLRLEIPKEELTSQMRPYNQYANRHLWARDVIRKAFYKVMGRAPTEAEEQLAQAVGNLEGGYGQGWKGAGRGSNNWGAIQCCMPDKKTGKCPPNTFPYGDSTPTAKGQKKYIACYKQYATPVDGAADLIKTIFLSKSKGRGQKTQVAAQIGSVPVFSSAMYDSKYYEGFGKDREARIRNHVKAMDRNLKVISDATKTPLALSVGEIIPSEDQINSFVDSRSAINTNLFQNSPAQNVQNEDNMKNYERGVDMEINQLMNILYASGPIETIVKRAVIKHKLPLTRKLISFDDSTPLEYNVRFAKILSTALRNIIDAECSIHYGDKNHIEVEVDAYGSDESVTKAVTSVSKSLVNVFKKASDKEITISKIASDKSSYPLIESSLMEKSFRKFAIDLWSRND